jgi:hypothetical protein
MSIQGGSVSQTKLVEIGAGPTAVLHNLLTLDVSASGTLNLPLNTACLNFINGATVVITSASLTTNQTILLVQTGGRGPVLVSLSGGGTIRGNAVYTLAGPVTLYFDGVNLV